MKKIGARSVALQIGKTQNQTSDISHTLADFVHLGKGDTCVHFIWGKLFIHVKHGGGSIMM